MIRLDLILLIFLFKIVLASSDNIDRKYVKCLVCYRVVEELFNEIGKPNGRLSSKDETERMHVKKAMKLVELQQSEIYFDDLMDRLCKKMGEYVRVFNKSSGQLEVIPLLISGKINVDLGLYDIIKDGDIESLEFYCQSIISEHEEDMLQLFKKGVSCEEYTQDLCSNPEICKLPLGRIPLLKDEL